jgi:hypothetical protein
VYIGKAETPIDLLGVRELIAVQYFQNPTNLATEEFSCGVIGYFK